MKRLEEYLLSSGNFKNIKFEEKFDKYVKFNLFPNFGTIKADQNLGVQYIGTISKAVQNLKEKEIETFLD